MLHFRRCGSVADNHSSNSKFLKDCFESYDDKLLNHEVMNLLKCCYANMYYVLYTSWYISWYAYFNILGSHSSKHRLAGGIAAVGYFGGIIIDHICLKKRLRFQNDWIGYDTLINLIAGCHSNHLPERERRYSSTEVRRWKLSISSLE